MKIIDQAKILIPCLFIIGLMAVMALPMPTAQAQGQPKPTPTNIPNEGSAGSKGGGNSRTESVPSQSYGEIAGGASVSGVVYNYSTGTPQAGLTVRLSQLGVEYTAVTNAAGQYSFYNLGFGKGLLNVDVPAGATPLAPDWPVTLQGETTANLAFYTGLSNPVPVQLTAMMTPPNILVVQVINRAGYPATYGKLTVSLPVEIEANSGASLNYGNLQYHPNQLVVDVSTLSPHIPVTLYVPLQMAPVVNSSNLRYAPTRSKPGRPTFVNEPMTRQADIPVMHVSFSYQQELAPQLIHVGVDGSSSVKPSVGAMQSVPGASIEVTVAGGMSVNPLEEPSAAPPLEVVTPLIITDIVLPQSFSTTIIITGTVLTSTLTE